MSSGDAAAIGEASAAAPLAVSSGESWPTPEQSLDITDAAQVSNGWRDAPESGSATAPGGLRTYSSRATRPSF